MKFHIIAPYYTNHPWGMEGRIIHWLKENDYEYEVTDLRLQSKDLVCNGWYDFLLNLHKKFDATLVIGAKEFTPNMVKALSHPRILWFTDDILQYPVYAEHIAKVGPHFNKVYSFDQEAVSKYEELGCKDVEFLPLFAGLDMYNCNDPVDRDIDVSFCGSINNDRKYVLDELHANGIEVYNKNIYGDDLKKIYNRSKIVINLAQGKTGINNRVFEAMACGAMVITNNINDDAKLFMQSTEIDYWNDIPELINLIKLYLKDNTLRKAKAENGRYRVTKYENTEQRMKKIIHKINFYNSEKEMLSILK